MAEKILIPLDGSKFGEAALRYIEELASRLMLGKKAEVILFQTITARTFRPGTGAASIEIPYSDMDFEQMKKEALEYLNEAGESLRVKGTTVSCEVTTGETSAEEIIKVAERLNADLVAMSTHGRHGIGRWALGSVADKVLRGSMAPVLVVRAK